MKKKIILTLLASAVFIAAGIFYGYVGKEMLSVELPKLFGWFVLVDGILTAIAGIVIALKTCNEFAVDFHEDEL